MAYVASQLIEEVTAHAQSDILEDARVICADGTYFPNNLRVCMYIYCVYIYIYIYIYTYIHTYIHKSKVIPLQARCGPEGG